MKNLILAITILCSSYCAGQKRIDWDHFDQKYAQELWLKEMRHYDPDVKLWNVLNKSSELQASYMLRENILTHKQKNKKFADLILRIEYYLDKDKNYFYEPNDLGEICSNYIIGDRSKFVYYEELVKNLIDSYCNSKSGHQIVIKNNKHEFVGSFIAFSIKENGTIHLYHTANFYSSYKGKPSNFYEVRWSIKQFYSPER